MRRRFYKNAASFAWRLTVALRPYGPSAPVRLHKAPPVCPLFERGCPVGAGDRMRQSRIISRKSRTTILAEESFPLCAYLLNLWLCEPLYPPALRATFFQKKASPVAHRLKHIPHGARHIAASQMLQKAEHSIFLPPLKGEGDRVSGGGVPTLHEQKLIPH